MASEKDRILDLLLEKTRARRIEWAYREASSDPLLGVVLSAGTYTEKIYTAQINADAGELFVVLRAHFYVPSFQEKFLGQTLQGPFSRRGREPAAEASTVSPSLTVRDVKKGVEILIQSDDADLRGKLRELWNAVQLAGSADSMVQILENA
jgi:hypothetical protein